MNIYRRIYWKIRAAKTIVIARHVGPDPDALCSQIALRDSILNTFPNEKVYAVNTTACGDSFNAGFIYEYLKTNDFESSLKKGTWCAARNAERDCPGTILNI